ncbi:hypothetical protein AB5I41_12180 [Sphingomonas sp. MMS24-JH45]
MNPRANVAIEHHPFPQCEAEMTLARQVADTPVRLSAARQGRDARGPAGWWR